MTSTPDLFIPTVLVVDDAAVDRLVAGRVLERQGGWRVAYAHDGADALAQIARTAPNAVVTDLQMPDVDGLGLVEQIRDRFPRVPVVVLTGQGSEELAVAALRAGASSYVTKRNLATELVPTLDQVLAASQSSDRRTRVLGGLTRRAARFVLENDPSLVSPLVGLMREDLTEIGVCDDHAATRVGVALEEALLNAMYHGNLEVSSDLKRDDEAAFHKLAGRRRMQPPYRDRRVRVTARLTPDRAVFVVSDEGPGFDTSKLPDPSDEACLALPSGRGVLLMRMFMDRVAYNSTGNRVTLEKRRPAAPTESP